MTREEQWLGALAGLDGVTPPDMPVWHYEEMLAAIYDAVIGASPARPFPARSWHLDEVLYAVYCAAAGLDDPGCPEPTCRIEMFWKGVYDGVKGEAGASVPTPVWRIEEFLKACFDASADWGGTLVSGNAPLTLPNAFTKPIKSLTQTGLCTQASTPTPSAPVPIKCNNGEIKWADSVLPKAYKRVLGFTCNNNAMWQITDFKLRGSDTLRFSVSITGNSNIIGVYTGSASGDNYSLYSQTNSSGNFLRYKDNAYPSYLDANERYDIVITPTGTHGMKVDSTWTEETFTTPTDMLVGTTSISSTSSKLRGKLYGDIIVDGRLHLVPCERLADNVLGYYDTIGETFYEPYTGFDGATSLGYDGSHYVLQTVGTAEVLTVTDADSNTQTASVVDLFSVNSYADTQDVIRGVVTHNVGIKVLDGTEGWKKLADLSVFWVSLPGIIVVSAAKKGLSTHYNGSDATNANMPDNSIKITFSGNNGVIAIKDLAYSTKDDFADYLAAQYAAGTPVIIVYPLATPTTEQVAAQPLTTAAGTNTVSVTAEVSPIELSCEYYGRGS